MIEKLWPIVIVASSLSALAIVSGCKDRTPRYQDRTKYHAQRQEEIRTVYGKIVDIDEDSFAIGGLYKGANFDFENLFVEADGKIYRLVYPGPSNYRVGDSVTFHYKPRPLVFYKDILNEGERTRHHGFFTLQDGSFRADGIIITEK